MHLGFKPPIPNSTMGANLVKLHTKIRLTLSRFVAYGLIRRKTLPAKCPTTIILPNTTAKPAT